MCPNVILNLLIILSLVLLNPVFLLPLSISQRNSFIKVYEEDTDVNFLSTTEIICSSSVRLFLTARFLPFLSVRKFVVVVVVFFFTGICVDKVNSSSCICNAGFTGRQCNVAITHCSSDSCYPGVPCTEKNSHIVCGPCPSGFTGDGKICKGN